MPWSPLQYTEEIFRLLKKWGHINQTTTTYLHRAIMLETKLIKAKTIAQTIRAFEQLGYIEALPNGNFKINYWKKEESKEKTKYEIEQEIEKYNEVIK